uniref:CD44 antigen n=1 Tax=Mastacembelus armatus TaxID=205130 RepID=A0A3Q3KZ80_9TELE
MQITQDMLPLGGSWELEMSPFGIWRSEMLNLRHTPRHSWQRKDHTRTVIHLYSQLLTQPLPDALPKMWTFLLGLTFGLLASSRSDQLQVNLRSCSIAGVFIVQGAHRHSLSFDMAEKVCEQEESIFASPDQVMKAYDKEMETCRNGWMNNASTAILRHTAHENCSKSMTGFIINSRVKVEDLFDAYCYDDQAGPGKNCTKEFIKKEAKPEDSSDSQSGPTVAPEGHITTAMADLDVDENRTMDSNLTVEEFDHPTGSGMVPTTPEDKEASPMAPVGEPEEKHPSSEKDEQNESKDYTTTEFPQQPTNGHVYGPTVPKSGQQESNSSLNWLVITLLILAIVAILLVCIAVAKRKSLCGQRQTLMITTKDSGEGNGAAAASSSSKAQEREQEMVTLMSTEKIQENGNTEEFTTITLEESPDKEQLA